MTAVRIRPHAFRHFGPDFDFSFYSRFFPHSHRLLCFKLLFSRFGFLRAWLAREYRVSLFLALGPLIVDLVGS